MARDRTPFELPSQQRLAYEIEKAAKSLGITVPSQEDARHTMETLAFLASIFNHNPQGNHGGFTTLQEQGLTEDRTQSSIILWGRSRLHEPHEPYRVSLMRTDFTGGRKRDRSIESTPTSTLSHLVIYNKYIVFL